MNNFPVDEMQRLAESSTVIGVNVSPAREKTHDYDFETHVSGWSILWRRLNPFSRRLNVPSLIGTILRTLEINSTNRSKMHELKEGILIEPDVSSISLLDFKSYQKAIDIGYEGSYELLKAWWESR